MKSPGDILRGGHQYDCSRRPCNFLRTRHDLPGNFSQLSGVQNTGASTQGQQITADRLRFKQIAPGFFRKKIFLSVFQLIPYA
ncbi:hypothetical protein BANRA_05438 [Escherichia coli]|nr:hypothetical protein BANRA_05438 [Escherichia coli]